MARGTKIWKNGKILPAEEAAISLYTHALHYGMGAFEGIRVYKQASGGGAVFRLHEHMVRLLDSIKIMGLEIPYDANALCQAAIETVKANGFDECYIRPIAYIGDGPLGLNPGPNPPVDLAILVWEWGKYLGDEGILKGIKVKVSSFNRPHPNSIMTKGKITGHYVTGVIARREAVLQGFDEALFLDPEGYLSEGTGENIFIVRHNKIKTTPLTSVLSGITRLTVIEHLERKGLHVIEERFTRDELWCSDEVFLVGTAAEITPVREIDHRKVGTGSPGPITTALQKDYEAIVAGRGPDYSREWLTPLR